MKSKKTHVIVISWWLSIFEALLVRYVKIDNSWLEQVKAAATRGPVVFILKNRSLIDLLCLRGLCRRNALPQPGFVSGISPFVFLPWWRWLASLLRHRSPDSQRRRLADTLKEGGSVVVFLRKPATVATLGSQPAKVDGVRLAVEAQEVTDTSLVALPTVFLWGEHPMKRTRGSLDFVFGTAEYPRLLRSMWLLIRNRSIHGVWSGEALELKALRRDRGAGNDMLTGIVKANIWRSIETIRRERLGSLTKPSSRIKEEVLSSGRLRKELTLIAQQEGIPPEDIIPRAKSLINKLATNFRPGVLQLFSVFMAFVWKRIYSGFEIEEADLENIRDAVGKGPLLLLPCHKSHIDYIAVSQVIATAKIMLPHIAAGENLSFWPLGWLFRSSGAFFIRRKFVNDRFYTAVVNAYIRRLLQQGYAIEVFIEGGRSRTGKLLRPKLGMLEMALRAMSDSTNVSPGVMPTFIGYERVIEEGAYVREAEGKKKKSESVGGLLKSSQVLLHRYGRLHVRTGNYFAVNTVLEEMGLTRQDMAQGNPRRAAALEIAMRTLNEINRISVATPSAVLATALLTMDANTFSTSSLREKCMWLMRFLNARNVSQSKLLLGWEQGPDLHSGRDLLGHTIKAFARGGRIGVGQEDRGELARISIKEGQRHALDYYKNNTLHFFVPSSIVCAALLSDSGAGVKKELVKADIALACALYRWEFLLPEYEPASPQFDLRVEEILQTGLAPLEALEILRTDDRGTITILDRDQVSALVGILRNYHELYYCALKCTRAKALGETEGDATRSTRQMFEQELSAGKLTMPEGNNRITIQNAMQAFKDLRLNRPMDGEHPYEDGELGTRLLDFLARTLARP